MNRSPIAPHEWLLTLWPKLSAENRALAARDPPEVPERDYGQLSTLNGCTSYLLPRVASSATGA